MRGLIPSRRPGIPRASECANRRLAKDSARRLPGCGCKRLFFRCCCASYSPSKTIFFFAKPATVRGRSAARTCQGRGFSRVHRRPLTGSTAGITPVFKARVEWGKKWKEKRLRLRTPNWRRSPGGNGCSGRPQFERRSGSMGRNGGIVF